MNTRIACLALLLGCGSPFDEGEDKVDSHGDTGDDPDGDLDGFPASEDCDDGDAEVNSAATELCDGIDNDCDGDTDEGVTSTYYADEDGDSYGNLDAPTEACGNPEGHVESANDCDDGDADVHPGALEVCDEVDNDCDGDIDEEDVYTWFADADSDGFGDPDQSVESCAEISGYVLDDTDCDDGSAEVSPDGIEICDELDNDCDGDIDEDSAADATTWYQDWDSDGYGDASSTATACTAPAGYQTDATDCDDAASEVNPGATEVCNDIDDDCDGDIDDDDSGLDSSSGSAWYTDADSDGYGDGDSAVWACDSSSGSVSDASDCDDDDGDIHPAATEICNDVDDDCDGDIDDDDSGLDTTTGDTWYQDWDSDGYGDSGASTSACDEPSGYVGDDTDCNDGMADINPGMAEACNGVDDDCDGTADSGVLGTGEDCPAESCDEILDDDSSAADGEYWIDFDGTATETECDMTTDGGGWTLIFEDDFEATPDGGWSLSSTYSCGSFSTILGGYGIIANGEIDIELSTYGVDHAEAWVDLEYMALDSWDGETAYVEADGTTLWSQAQNNHSSSYGEVCGWNRGYYGSYDSQHDVSETLSHSAATLTLVAGSTLDQGATDESFGIDDVMVWVR